MSIKRCNMAFDFKLRIKKTVYKVSFFNESGIGDRSMDHMNADKDLRSWVSCLHCIHRDHRKNENNDFWVKLPLCKYIQKLKHKGLIYTEFALLNPSKDNFEILIR